METKQARRARIKNRIFGALFVTSLIFLMIAVSYSWFSDGSTAQVSGITMRTDKANNLVIRPSGDASEWGKELKMVFPEGFQVQPVAGDGVDFFEAILQKDEGTGNHSVQAYTGISPENYAEKGIYQYSFTMMVENSLPVCLGKTSFIDPADPSSKDGIYGEYSAGYICAAMRVAILCKNGDTFEPCLIWIPHATTRLITVGETQVRVNGTAQNLEESYLFLSGSKDETNAVSSTEILTKGATSGVCEQNGVTYVWGNLSEIQESLAFARLEANTPSEFQLVIWLDGNDRECHNALMNGNIRLQLDFSVDDTQETTQAETETDQAKEEAS